MKATKATATSIGLKMEEFGGLFLENQESCMQTKFVVYNSGILFLECFDYLSDFKQRIELIAGCFEPDSNIEEVLREKGVLNTFEKLDGIVMTVGRIPVLATRLNHNPKKLYIEWEEQMEADKK